MKRSTRHLQKGTSLVSFKRSSSKTLKPHVKARRVSTVNGAKPRQDSSNNKRPARTKPSCSRPDPITVKTEDAAISEDESMEEVPEFSKLLRAGRKTQQVTPIISFENQAEADEHAVQEGKEITQKRLFTDTAFEEMGELVKEADGVPQTVNPKLLSQLKAEGFTQMTRIQRDALFPILRQQDVMIRSETGSGKTLAFLFPAIQLLLNTSLEGTAHGFDRSAGTRILILAPTRELVHQTIQLAERLTIPFPRIVVGSITGGEKRKSEKARLRKGVTILGATVGRICDHLDTTASFVVTHLKLLVMDEADRLLDMGFEKKLRWIVHKLKEMKAAALAAAEFRTSEISTHSTNSLSPSLGKAQPNLSLQSVLLSATLTAAVRRLASFVLNEQTQVWVGEQTDQNETVEGILFSVKDVRNSDGDQNSDLRGGIPESLAQSTSKASAAILTIPKQLHQRFSEINLKNRLSVLFAVLMNHARKGKVVVFLSNCDSVEFHHALCQVARWPTASALGGQRSEEHRNLNRPPKMRISDPELRKFVGLGEGDADDSDESDFEEPFGSAVQSSHTATKLDDKRRSEEKRAALSGLLGDLLFPDTRFYKLHGNLSQQDRLGCLADFNRSTANSVLFTTDVAARGLNLHHVRLVIQCDPAQEIEEYVHRVGRTGRIGAEGSALLFLLEHERHFSEYLRNLGADLNPVPEIELMQPMMQEFVPSALRAKRIQNLSTYLTSFLCRQVEADLDLLHLARRAFTSSYRSYRCFGKNLKPFFNVKSIHLGHLATAFGLSESPSVIGEKCRQGAIAAAARKIVEQHKLKRQTAKTIHGLSENEPKEARQSSQRHFSRVGAGLLDNPKRMTVAKGLAKLVAAQKQQRHDSEVAVQSQKANRKRNIGNGQATFSVVPQSTGNRREGRSQSATEGGFFSTSGASSIRDRGVQKTRDPVAAALACLKKNRDILVCSRTQKAAVS